MNYNISPTTESPGQQVSEGITLRTIDVPVLLGHCLIKFGISI